jgi:regulator of protease activity HflC (stomatin/prohibitin superfamily)
MHLARDPFALRLFCTAIPLVTAAGCATVVSGHERALYYSAHGGLDPHPVASGWHWHLPWNDYITYDLRWTSHKESIHIHSRDGLHMNVDLVVVVRPAPNEIYALETDVGPAYYDQVVKPAVFAAARDASGKFGHLEIATHTHEVEHAIHDALVEHLRGKHVELSEVAVQHFDLPDEVERAANRTASASALLAAKDVELALAGRDAAIDQEKKRGVLEAQGIERKLRAQQELEDTTSRIRIEEEKRKAELARVQAEADAERIRAEGEAHATRVRAEAERTRVQAISQNLSPNYVRIQALDSLSKVLAAGNTKVMVLPVGKDGLPAYLSPFLNPFGATFGALQGSDAKPRGESE